MAEKAEPKTAPREYVVVKRTGVVECEIVGSFMATSASRAVDFARNGGGGRWVAVPARNWNEEDLEIVEREPTVTRKKIHPGQQSIEMPPAEPVAA